MLSSSSALVATATLLTLAAACGAPQSTAQTESDVLIVGGNKVSDSQDDARRVSTVALTTDTKGSDPGKPALIERGVSFCTGTIIGRRTILTAAHCVQDFDALSGRKKGLLFPKDSDFLVYFGTQVKNNRSFVRAAKVSPHPEWDPRATTRPTPNAVPNDIAIITLSEDIPSGYEPVEIADAGLRLDGETVALAGFGVPLSRTDGDTGTLRQVDVQVTGVSKGAKQISVGALFKGACAGDSGGPAFLKVSGRYQVIGATSSGAEINSKCIGVMTNYTDARQYKAWIASAAR